MRRLSIPTLCAVLGLILSPVSASLAEGTKAPPKLTAPAFTLKDLNGKPFTLKEQRGKVVVLNFWATWCGPCRKEMPALSALHQKYKTEKVSFLSVSVDGDSTVGDVARLVKEGGYQFPILLDTDNNVVNIYNPDGIVPYTTLIDAQGVVRYIHKGYEPGEEAKVEAELKELLAELDKKPATTKKPVSGKK